MARVSGNEALSTSTQSFARLSTNGDTPNNRHFKAPMMVPASTAYARLSKIFGDNQHPCTSDAPSIQEVDEAIRKMEMLAMDPSANCNAQNTLFSYALQVDQAAS
uniref:Uncharacterized protein n=1 Tax=Arundo donax TaxID=35708 RepID=A0A0A9A410_ARUDO